MKKRVRRKKKLGGGKRDLQNWGLTHMSDTGCINTLAALRWPEGMPICPACQGKQHSFLATAKKRLWQCKRCRKQHSVRIGTIFEGSQITLSKWLGALLLEVVNGENGISSHELSRQLAVTQKTAWFMLLRLRKALQLAATPAIADSVAHVRGAGRTNLTSPQQEEETTAAPSSIAMWCASMRYLWHTLGVSGFKSSDTVKLEAALRLILRVPFSDMQRCLAVQKKPRAHSEALVISATAGSLLLGGRTTPALFLKCQA